MYSYTTYSTHISTLLINLATLHYPHLILIYIHTNPNQITPPFRHLIQIMDSQNILLQELDSINNTKSINCTISDLKNKLSSDTPHLSIIIQNIRSVHKSSNIDDLDVNISMLKQDIDVVVLTECRINPDKPLPIKPDYITYSSQKKTNQNDGVVVLIKKAIRHTVREVTLFKASCLEITTPTNTIICIYRSPSEKNPDKFINSLDNYLNAPHLKINTTLAGDININIIEGNKDKHSDLYLDMLAGHSLLPGHRFDTRLNSCLDHVFTNLDPSKTTATVAVLDTTITDHKMVLMNLYVKNITHKPRQTKTSTNYSDAHDLLKTKNITELFDILDPNILCHNLIDLITNCLHEHTITINISNNKRILKPWITSGILKCIKHRNKLQKQLRSDATNEILKITYRRYRNFCNNLIKKLKKQYERDLLNKSKNSNKTLWNCIKNITYLNKDKSVNKELINLKRTPTQSAEYINKHFNAVGRTLAENITPNINQFEKYCLSLPQQSNSIGLIEPEPAEIEAIINSLKSDSAAGWDKIPAKFIKMAKGELVPIITHLSVLCFQQGIFPRELKRSIIHPVYKSGDKDDIGNYRPISILPVLSKILEKLINNRLNAYLNSFKLLSKSQYGFRSGISTEDAILDLTKNITQNLDNKTKTLCIFLDLKKAFDTVFVPTLLRKIEKLGIRGSFLSLLTNYLKERTQRVKLSNDIFSHDENTSNYGVPQGSVLGPTLFLMYINDLTSIQLSNGKVLSYADDTALLFHGKTWQETYQLAETGLQNVIQWLNLNTLTLNTLKTNFITFSILDSSQPNPNLKIKAHFCNNNQKSCDCKNLEKVNKTKYLGIVLDKNLSWHPQLELVANRARKLIWIFKYLRDITDQQLITYIYKTLVQSILLYCLTIWGGTHKSKFISIERAQRHILKVMLRKKKRFSTYKLYSEANVLTVRQLYILQCTLKTHKTLTIDRNLLNKRTQRSVIISTKTRTSFASKQYCAQSTKIYNTVNKKKNIYTMSHQQCKRKLTSWLQSLTYQQTEDLLVSMYL